MSFTEIQQSQRNINGYFSGLNVNSHFSGTIDVSRHIRFIVTGHVGSATPFFDGSMQTDGNLAGSHGSLGQNGQCAGEYSIWSAAPAS